MSGSHLFHLSLDFQKCILKSLNVFKICKIQRFLLLHIETAQNPAHQFMYTVSGKIKFLLKKGRIFKPHPESSPLSDL